MTLVHLNFPRGASQHLSRHDRLRDGQAITKTIALPMTIVGLGFDSDRFSSCSHQAIACGALELFTGY